MVRVMAVVKDDQFKETKIREGFLSENVNLDGDRKKK